MTVTRDQAQRIARAIFDDVEMSGLFSLDRVTDVIERTARMERQEDEELDRKIAELYRRHRSDEATSLFSPEFDNLVALVARIHASFVDQTIIQPDD